MWRVEHDPGRSLLEIRARALLSRRDVDDLAHAWARALASTATQPTIALFDLRGLDPLEGEAVTRLRDRVKAPALSLPHIQRLVILVDSATCAMQQRNAVLDLDRELVTQSEGDARAAMGANR